MKDPALMKTTLKIWTSLGLGTALAGGLIAGCADEVGKSAGTDATAGADSATEAPGVGGEGEGGVAVSQAASDPVAYGIALAVTEAHVVAARDAYAAGRKEAAAEMFAHPAAEVLVEMDPVFAKLGVADFKPLLAEASLAASEGRSLAEVDKAYGAIIAALRGAAAKAPKAGKSQAQVAIGVVADQVERASAMYRTIARDDRYEPYLDGYGFARVAASRFAAEGAAIKAENPEAHARIAAALDMLAKAYPTATRPGRLAVEPGALSALSARVLLAVG
jgi:hypothetical protein